MTDTSTLRELAERATRGEPPCTFMAVYQAAANPQAILALLDALSRAEAEAARLLTDYRYVAGLLNEEAAAVSALSGSVTELGQERDAAIAERDEWKRAFTEVKTAAERVCWFDWSGNDDDAVRAMKTLADIVIARGPS